MIRLQRWESGPYKGLGHLVANGDVVLDGFNELANVAKLPISQPV